MHTDASPTQNAGDTRTQRRNTLVQHEGAWIDVIVDEGRASTAGPLVLLPSSLRGQGDFDLLATMLALRGFKVLRPWPRGMGRSTGSLQGLSLSALAADAICAVRELGAGAPAVLLGHAFGHFVARVADLEHPAWVRGVVVAAAAARVFPPGVSDSLHVASDPGAPRADRLRGLQHAFFAPGNDPTPWLDGWHPELRAAYRHAGGVPDKSVWWPVANAPILDLQAEADPWRPEATRYELRDALGADKVTVRLVAGASHALPAEQPLAVAEAVHAWTQGLAD